MALYSYLLLLLDKYEDTIPKVKISGVMAMSFLMNKNGNNQSYLSDVAPRSVICEVLSGKRQLNKNYIERLARRYYDSHALFFDQTILHK